MSASAATRAKPTVAILIVNGIGRRGPSAWGMARRRDNADQACKYPWIDLCLRQIERRSQGWDYEVSVFDNSHLKLHRRLMHEHPHVRVLPGAWFSVLGRIVKRVPIRHSDRLFELAHPRALDYLASKVSANVDYVVTLDTDSFPVRDDWLDVLVSACERGAAVAGVYRNEMAPEVRPFIHVSGFCARRNDLRALGVSFGRKLQVGSEYNEDVGQKITYEFLRLGREIAPLERSNKVNYHPIVGGIYGDVIYHQGAGSRAAWFRTAGEIANNTKVSTALRSAAFQDVDHLIAVLRGEVPEDLGVKAL
jgi:hypothetical protein